MASKSTNISTALIGRPFSQKQHKFGGIIPAGNGKLYLVPFCTNKVVSFNPRSNEWKEIGDDTGDDGFKWHGGCLGADGKIYCNPYNSDDILVVDPSTETTTRLPLPEELRNNLFKYCSSSPDRNGNIFFFPLDVFKVLKLEISTSTVTILDIQCGRYWNHATLASDGHIYVMPHCEAPTKDYIMDFDPADEDFHKVHHSTVSPDNIYSKLTMGQDGRFLYGISKRNVIKIHVRTNYIVCTEHDLGEGHWTEWTDCIVDREGFLYAVSFSDNRIVQHDPFHETTTAHNMTEDDAWGGWSDLAIGRDGNVYCAPFDALQILKICIPRGHWLYLKHRLLVECDRATTHNLRQGDVVGDDKDRQDLETVRRFIIHTNDDIFRHCLEFV